MSLWWGLVLPWQVIECQILLVAARVSYNSPFLISSRIPSLVFYSSSCILFLIFWDNIAPCNFTARQCGLSVSVSLCLFLSSLSCSLSLHCVFVYTHLHTCGSLQNLGARDFLFDLFYTLKVLQPVLRTGSPTLHSTTLGGHSGAVWKLLAV